MVRKFGGVPFSENQTALADGVIVLVCCDCAKWHIPAFGLYFVNLLAFVCQAD